MTESTLEDSSLPHVKPSALSKTVVASSGISIETLPTHSRVSGSFQQTGTQKRANDTTSDKATTAFIRRTLCSHNVLLGNGQRGRTTPQPIEELLPPLTSSNEVDLQLYGIISVIIKEFVHTWYSKITPDHVFVNEVIQIIAHCTRGLEQRLRKIDLEALLLDEIPGLFEDHLRSFRLAKQRALDNNSLVLEPRTVYHTLHPHPALSPVPNDSEPQSVFEQRQNESSWRQLIVQGVLAALLPTEDLENGCLRALVAEIFAEMILGNGISGKACEGWLLWEGITRIAEVLQVSAEEEEVSSSDEGSEQALSRLERYGLLSSNAGAAQAPEKPLLPNEGRHEGLSSTVSTLFWVVVQYVFLACSAMRAVLVGLATSSSLPSRSVTTGASGQPSVEASRQSNSQPAQYGASKRPLALKRPILSMTVWSCMSQLVELDMRMPWLSGLISMLHWGALDGPGRVGDTDGVLDRFLSYTLRTKVLNPAFLPIFLRTIRATLFPNNTLAPPRTVPTSEEVQKIKRRCASMLLRLLPPRMAAVYFASQDREVMLAQVEELLECLGDPYLNKHFIFQIVELIVVRLVPELGERGVKELLDERLG